MEPFTAFQEELIHGDTMLYWSFSPEPNFDLIAAIPEPTLVEPPVVRKSAFKLYTRTENEEGSSSGTGGRRNIHRRVIEMLKRIPDAKEERKGGLEMSRGFRHMMRERQRREKLSQSYADLHSMLSFRSKSDKNSIVQAAAMYVRELKEVKDQLQKRNEELESMILGSNGRTEAKVKFRVGNPSSAMDSLIGALRCLKSMDVKARSIRSDLSGHELSAIMSIETKVAAGDVEREVESALREAEGKLLRPLPRTHGPSQLRHAENVP